MKNKARKNKGKDETEQLLLYVPQVCIDQCKIETIKEVLNKFNNANSVEEQIEIIRILSADLNGIAVDNVDCIISLLSDLFVNASPKSPVKKSILRTFASCNSQSQISTILSQQLLVKIKSNDENNVHSCNECVSAVNDCFDNFPAGVAGVSLVLADVFAFLVNYLKRLVQDLSGTVSPVVLQDLQLNIHNCTRCFVAVCQQCNIKSVILEYTDVIFEQCIAILNNTGVSFDTKNNCGIVLVTAANCSVQNGYTLLLEMCLNKDVSKWGISSADMQDDITVTCVCSGILNVITANELCYKVLNKSALLVMCDKLLQLAESSAGNPSAVLGVNRSLLLVSRTLAPLDDNELVVIVTNLLDHVWTQFDHYVDTIRHVAKSTLVNLVKLAKNHTTNPDGLLNIIVDSVLKTSAERSTRYRALAVISQEAGCEVMLSQEPMLVSQLLTQALDISIAIYVLSCYENLMRCHLREVTDKLWIQTWVTPLVSELGNDTELHKTGSHLQHLLIIAIKLKPSILDAILSQWSVDNQLQLSSLLKCTLITRRMGLKMKETSDKWRGLLDYSVLKLGMCHQNDDVRIASLALIVESHKSTEIFTEWELKYIVTFLQYNINTQLPASRQQIMSLVKKILNRFDDGYYALLRNYNRLPGTGPDEIRSAIFVQKTQYEQFVFTLRDCIFDSLFPGANFSRRIICLEILTLLEPILPKVLNARTITADQLWKRHEADAILSCLSDSYESNKKLAASLLAQCPAALLNLHTIEDTRRFVQDALGLAASVKPADTVTGAYMLETAGYSPVLRGTLLKMWPDKEARTAEYHLVHALLQQLETEVEMGRENLLRAAASGPMHGTLFCLRHLLEKYLFSSTTSDKVWYWKPLVSRIITTCFDVCTIVGPVVNNSSPEGHLPMDQELCDEDETITAQMLLVCAWRSVKEVSLLLGELTLRLEIHSLIREEQVLQIGEHFTVLLTETKHRGAFEQAYVGFAKLCTRLWKCKSKVLHQLPVTWLTEIMNAISGQTPANHKLCATRRSAGVPYMIQAIISSELQCGSSTHFAHCMEMLLQLATNAGDNVETRTHGMNVLRALYRHTQLGEVVTPYLAAGITASILGFSRKTWAERNSATLLFASLMTRIFGVQRYRDQLSIRNRMTARVFFLRHPTLHDFLLHQLRQLTAAECAVYKEVALYPILLLLARLYPSTVEENDANNELEDFIPYVKQCARIRGLKTRELAARALVPLVPAQKRNELVQELFASLESSCLDQNYIHGVLLQILHLVKASHDFRGALHIETILRNSLWIVRTCSTISASIYMEIIILLTSNTHDIDKDSPLWQGLLALLRDQDTLGQNNFTIGRTLHERTTLHLQLHLLLNISAASFEDISAYLLTKLSHNNDTIKEFILNFIICCLKTQDTEFVLNCLEMPDEEENLTHLTPPQFKTSLAAFLAENPVQFVDKLVNIIKCNERLCARALFIVSHCAHATLTLGRQDGRDPFGYFKELVYATSDDVATAVLCCIRTCFNQLTEENLEQMYMDEVFDILLEFSWLNNSVSCRYIVAMILVENAELLFISKRIKYEYLVTLWRTVMQLLEDSEPLVRNTISKLSKCSVTAEKCREILLSACVDRLKAISEEKCTGLLIFWALTDRDPYTSDEDYEGQVFERGEVNTYVESMCLSRLSAKMLKNLVGCESLNEIPAMFQSIMSILNSDTQIFVKEFPEKGAFVIILQELLDELSNKSNEHQVLRNYFNESQNTWHRVNSVLKYKIHQIIRNIVPESVDF